MDARSNSPLRTPLIVLSVALVLCALFSVALFSWFLGYIEFRPDPRPLPPHIAEVVPSEATRVEPDGTPVHRIGAPLKVVVRPREPTNVITMMHTFLEQAGELRHLRTGGYSSHGEWSVTLGVGPGDDIDVSAGTHKLVFFLGDALAFYVDRIDPHDPPEGMLRVELLVRLEE